MSILNLVCNECGEEVEVYCDGDNAIMCPECRSVDNFSELPEDIIAEMKMDANHPPIPAYQLWAGEYKDHCPVVENPTGEAGHWRWYLAEEEVYASSEGLFGTKEEAMLDCKNYIEADEAGTDYPVRKPQSKKERAETLETLLEHRRTKEWD